jgi:hypothetical protein
MIHKIIFAGDSRWVARFMAKARLSRPEDKVQALNLDFLSIILVLMSRMAIMPISAIKKTASVLIVPKIWTMAIIPKRIRKAPLNAGNQDLS